MFAAFFQEPLVTPIKEESPMHAILRRTLLTLLALTMAAARRSRPATQRAAS